jgi:hypothetical protein
VIAEDGKAGDLIVHGRGFRKPPHTAKSNVENACVDHRALTLPHLVRLTWRISDDGEFCPSGSSRSIRRFRPSVLQKRAIQGVNRG